METTEFQMDSCVLMVTICTKKFRWHFGKELPTKNEFGNFVDDCAMALKKVSSNYVP